MSVVSSPLPTAYGKTAAYATAYTYTVTMENRNDRWEIVREALERLYREVDEQAGRLSALHAGRLQCRRGCCSCCEDGITVFELEAENIRFHYQKLLREGFPHPEGACAFLDEEGACRIYAHRPYVCRTQGLPLRWIEELPQGEAVEMRAICPLNEKGQPVETLSAQACWSIGPVEGRLAELQKAMSGGELRRISLRSLFPRR